VREKDRERGQAEEEELGCMIRLGFRFRLGSVRAGGMDWWTSGERGREGCVE
jgi:hypothetical protein